MQAHLKIHSGIPGEPWNPRAMNYKYNRRRKSRTPADNVDACDFILVNGTKVTHCQHLPTRAETRVKQQTWNSIQQDAQRFCQTYRHNDTLYPNLALPVCCGIATTGRSNLRGATASSLQVWNVLNVQYPLPAIEVKQQMGGKTNFLTLKSSRVPYAETEQRRRN